MQHSHAEVPQQQATVLSHTSYPIIALVASPWIEGDGTDPRVVALAPRNQHAIFQRPDGDEVILASGNEIPTVRRPADAHHASIIALEEIEKPVRVRAMPADCNGDSRFLEKIDDADRAIFSYNSNVPTVW